MQCFTITSPSSILQHIFTWSKTCLSNFGELTKSLNAEGNAFLLQLSPLAVENEVGRFKVWAANVGAFDTGRSSLDTRLKDAVSISTHILSLLDYLKDSICRGQMIPLTSLHVPADV